METRVTSINILVRPEHVEQTGRHRTAICKACPFFNNGCDPFAYSTFDQNVTFVGISPTSVSDVFATHECAIYRIADIFSITRKFEPDVRWVKTNRMVIDLREINEDDMKRLQNLEKIFAGLLSRPRRRRS